MFGLGTTELIVIGVIILFIFGVKRLPEIGKGLGGAVREFRKIKRDLRMDSENSGQDKVGKNDKEKPKQLENKIAEDFIQKVPGVKEIVDTKNKIDKVSEIIRK